MKLPGQVEQRQYKKDGTVIWITTQVNNMAVITENSNSYNHNTNTNITIDWEMPHKQQKLQ